jgi:hypothetical protein
MTQIFLVIAYGGQYEDAWERVLRACYSEEAAQTAIDNLVKYLDEIRGTELPESLEGCDFDFNDDDDICRHHIALNEFKDQVLIDMGVPEVDREWLLENWEHSYPFYRIQEVVLQ